MTGDRITHESHAPPRFGLLVTGKGEARFLHQLFGKIAVLCPCSFEVIRKIEQLDPVSSRKRQLKMLGRAQTIPSKDQYISFAARSFLRNGGDYLLLVDDLEWDRLSRKQEVYDRYRSAVDHLLDDEQKRRASVHFLVMMLEAYYFADTAAVNEVLGVNLSDYADDVETIRHPKNDLKKLAPGFSEIEDGAGIVKRLKLEHILSDPKTCAALRTAVAWCAVKLGVSATETFHLNSGRHDSVTVQQLEG